MAYKYFTEKLLKSKIDISQIFPEKIAAAKQMNNVAYGLPEITEYIRASTNNFKSTDKEFIDLDDAVRQIVYKFFDSTGQINVFEDTDAILLDDSGNQMQPREAALVEDGKIKGKDKAPETTKKKMIMPSNDDIMATINGLRLLAEEGDKEAQEAIAGFELLLS